ncbi:hypothetical protein P691DRAFT_787425 [Macrolepiota fuliginosa MF-IS2]|uniref:NAD(P)-binding domain-containing protein n=1 Tax=Macrolepiota fuliginosa MF-IS2 TaxID=1400762 RepID=A0A9P5X3K0_9AGAR|nr:hypothetical protein P691DRAFT_787425 [Macrolepiota fuliginosa MF-IS2]
MTILLTGGTGKTSVPLARLLSTQSTHSVLLASRKGTKPETLSGLDHSRVHATKFDWFDRTSWGSPFDCVALEKLPAIDAVYLIAPAVWDVEEVMGGFIDFAREKGVNKFVLLSASQGECGGRVAIAAPIKIEQVSLIVLTFSENLGEYQIHSIRDEDTFYSVWEDGKCPFVSAEDIAQAAFDILIGSPEAQSRINNDFIIHGPELFTNDELARLLSMVLLRTITHTRITKEEFLRQWKDLGFEELGRGLLESELRIAQGSEEAIFRHEKAVEGKGKMRDYIDKNKHLWMK